MKFPMSGQSKKNSILTVLFLTACAIGVRCNAPAQTATGAEVPKDWLAAAQQDIAQSEYNVSPQEHGSLPESGTAWQAPNRRQGLRSYFTEKGIRSVSRTGGTGDWTWGLELTGVGGDCRTEPAPALQDVCADGNRITFERDGMAQWYVNGESGVRTGFTVHRSPGSDGQLVLRMAVRGDLTASMAPDEKAVEFMSSGGVGVLRYGELEATDAQGKALPTAMTVSGDTVELSVNAAGASYPITVAPKVAGSAWLAEGQQVYAAFGWSVSTAGDVNSDGFSDIIVGAYSYDNGEANEGRAYAYYGSASGLPFAPNWTVESNQADARLGSSVSTAGDVNGDGYSDVIVGAYNYSNGEESEGRALVYHGSAAGLPGSPNWTAESNLASAYFGCAVSTAGDVNGDGYSDVIIGATGYSNGQTAEGRATVYHGSAAGLSVSPNWAVESDQAIAVLGVSVSSAGDVNGDGFSDVIVGASGYDNGEMDEGRAYVFQGSAAGLSPTANWTAESDQAGASFGCSVAGAGDVNGDGYADVVVGAYAFDSVYVGEGRAYVYYGSATGLFATAGWEMRGSQENAYFGYAVATAGDVNGDGYADVIVGAYQYDNGQTDEGVAKIFYGSASGPSGTADLVLECDQASANFGRAVSTAGDVNGDGYADVIVGASNFANGQTGEGRAFVYYGAVSGLNARTNWAAEGDQANAYYGYSAASAGDVNGDGYSDVIIGAFGYDNGQTNEGRVFVYQGSANGLSPLPDWTAESDQAGAFFGISVSSAGDVNGDGYDDVIVGAEKYDNGQVDEGRAFVYYGSDAGLYPMASWTAEGNQASDGYGSCVSKAGDVNGDGYGDVVVGARDYSNGQTSEGRIFVYHGSAAGLSATANWTAESDQVNAVLGWSVSAAGDVNGDGFSDVIAGARDYTNGENAEGAAFVYLGSTTGLAAGPAWTGESNQTSGHFGYTVSSAGDVNGDGYSDVIVGCIGYGNGEIGEGAAFVYHGSAAGLSPVANWKVEGNQAGANLGSAVGTAGDVNGDGYSDVIVGAYGYDNPELAEGLVSVYHGSPSGLSLSPNWSVESNQAGASLGYSAAGAGDVNGDGYSDVITGAPYSTNGESGEGAVSVYYGNGHGGGGLSLNPRQRRGDDSAPLAQLNTTAGTTARLAVLGRTPFGRTRVKLECEVKPWGSPFDGTGTVKTEGWVSTGTVGAELSQLVSGLYAGALQHWRVRLLYNTTSCPLQQKSRWFTMPVNGAQEGDFRVPIPPMTGSIVINTNRSATNNPVVTLALAWGGGGGTGVVRMRFSNDGSTWTAWEPLAASKPYTLPAGDGHKTVRVQYLDKLNNKSAVFSDFIRLDTTLPTGTIVINNGALTTTTQSVTLKLTWSDAGAGVTRMRFSDNGSTWTYWMAPTATRAYTLPAGLGYHTVRVQYLDGANNYSAVYNDYIKVVP